MELFGKIRDRSVSTSELLQDAASGGVRERGKRGIESAARILNHTVQYVPHQPANASGLDQDDADGLGVSSALTYARA